MTIGALLSLYRTWIVTSERLESSHLLMIAFANEWGWWAVPAFVAAAAGMYMWRSRLRESRAEDKSDEFLTVEQTRRSLNAGEQLVLADVRSQSSYDSSATTISGAVRLHPARPIEDARALSIPPETKLLTFCA